METTQLGRSGLTISRLALGTANYSFKNEFTSEAECHNLIDTALELGINFIDTGKDYGDSEEIIGHWLATDPSRRSKIVLGTKFGGGGDNKSSSARTIKWAVEQSLRKLKTDHIDLYQAHHIDRNTPWEEVFGAFEQLYNAGKVLYFGSSNYAGWHITAAAMTARQRGFLGFVSEQSIYNLDERYVELEVLPACRHFGLAFIPYCPVARGMLGGILQTVPTGRRAQLRDRILANPVKRAQIDQYESFCKELGQPPAVVAMAWVLGQEGVTAPIIGARTPEQLVEAVAALKVKLGAEEMKRLNEIWPTHWRDCMPGGGKEAPEAYGW